MDTRSVTEIKKVIAKVLEADRQEMFQQIHNLQNQIQELAVSQHKRVDEEVNSGEASGSGTRGHKEHPGWHPNDIKVDIPEYDGKLDPDEFVEWIRIVERVFDYKHSSDDNKVKIVALKLRKYASTWWSNVCQKRERMEKERIKTWPKMKEKMTQKFLPSYYLQASFSQLHNIKQGTCTVEDYSRNFEYLLMKCDVPEDDPQTLVRYLRGLEPHVANVVELHTYETLAELTMLAHKVDSQQWAKGKQEGTEHSFKSNQNLRTTSAMKPTMTLPPVTTTPNTDFPKAPRRCFRCQGLGHIASECPNKRIITLTDYEQSSGYEFSTESNPTLSIIDDVEEDLVGPDEGECLVIRRALNTTLVKEQATQREAIFHTRCTIVGRVCSVIIDSGSCTNVASQTQVTKLSLPMVPNPSPYVIHWLNHGKGMTVKHRVLVALSIGRSYVDEIWCDVLPMEACHVLLGRPWQFDRQVTHDGYRNTYSLIHNSRKVTLTPISHTTQSTNPLSLLSALLRVGQTHGEVVTKRRLDDDMVAKTTMPSLPHMKHLSQAVF